MIRIYRCEKLREVSIACDHKDVNFHLWIKEAEAQELHTKLGVVLEEISRTRLREAQKFHAVAAGYQEEIEQAEGGARV